MPNIFVLLVQIFWMIFSNISDFKKWSLPRVSVLHNLVGILFSQLESAVQVWMCRVDCQCPRLDFVERCISIYSSWWKRIRQLTKRNCSKITMMRILEFCCMKIWSITFFPSLSVYSFTHLPICRDHQVKVYYLYTHQSIYLCVCLLVHSPTYVCLSKRIQSILRT